MKRKSGRTHKKRVRQTVPASGFSVEKFESFSTSVLNIGKACFIAVCTYKVFGQEISTDKLIELLFSFILGTI